MPAVVRGSRASQDLSSLSRPNNLDLTSESPATSPIGRGRVSFAAQDISNPTSPLHETTSNGPFSPGPHNRSTSRRMSTNPDTRPEEDAYYDSRAATQREFRRRGTTLQEYYSEHPSLLPQLPFTMHHGWKRWKLFGLITLAVIDACVIPLVLYYGLYYGGNVQGWIIFAIVTTVWGGPTYVEFAVRSWRLWQKKSDFYRPLGTSNRWAFDITHWVFVITISSVTALFIIGSAPHIVWLRVLSMPGPAILYSMGGCLFVQTMWSLSGRPAPFRLSSTPKGGKVHPGVYYFIEDIIAVNANAGRPFREALAARYEASPRFRRMIKNLSLFWSIPSLFVAIVCTVVVCIHPVSQDVAYAIGWAVPFIWAGIWVAITIPWAKREMRKERITWELDNNITPLSESKSTPDKESDKDSDPQSAQDTREVAP